MSELTSVGAITLFVADTQRSKAFYEEVFGAPAIFEDESSVAFRFDNLIVNLTRREVTLDGVVAFEIYVLEPVVRSIPPVLCGLAHVGG